MGSQMHLPACSRNQACHSTTSSLVDMTLKSAFEIQQNQNLTVMSTCLCMCYSMSARYWHVRTRCVLACPCLHFCMYLYFLCISIFIHLRSSFVVVFLTRMLIFFMYLYLHVYSYFMIRYFCTISSAPFNVNDAFCIFVLSIYNPPCSIRIFADSCIFVYLYIFLVFLCIMYLYFCALVFFLCIFIFGTATGRGVFLGNKPRSPLLRHFDSRECFY